MLKTGLQICGVITKGENGCSLGPSEQIHRAPGRPEGGKMDRIHSSPLSEGGSVCVSRPLGFSSDL